MTTSSRVYRPSWTPKAFYVFATSADGTRELNSLQAIPRGESWVPVPVEPVWEDDYDKPLLDLDVPYNGHLIVRERVVDRLRPLLEPFGELLPLAWDNAEALWVFNPTVVVDALDTEATRHHVYEDGRFLITGTVILKRDHLPEGGIFRVPQALQGTEVFYMDDIVAAIKKLKLSGLTFDEVPCS